MAWHKRLKRAAARRFFFAVMGRQPANLTQSYLHGDGWRVCFELEQHASGFLERGGGRAVVGGGAADGLADHREVVEVVPRACVLERDVEHTKREGSPVSAPVSAKANTAVVQYLLYTSKPGA